MLTVLETLATSNRSLTVAELATSLGISRPQAHRIVAALEKEGVLARHPRSGRLIFGLRLTRAVLRIAGLSPLPALWRPVLQGIVDEVGETCNLLVFPAATPTYLDRVEARWPLSLHFRIGSRVPLHCTAIGKLFLAYLPEPQRRSLLENIELPLCTPATITGLPALEKELAAIRKEGLSIDREEYLLGVVCCAVPIFNTNGDIRAGVAIQAPAARLSASGIGRHRDRLIQAADQLTGSFDFE